VKVAIAGGAALLLIALYLFLVYFPTQAENRIKEQKIAQINNLNSCLIELSDNIVTANKSLSMAKTQYKKLTNLFHSGQELDDLYRHISMLALSNQLMVVKIQKTGESPVFENSESSEVQSNLPDSINLETSGEGFSVCDNLQVDDMPVDDTLFVDDFQDQFVDSGNGDEDEQGQKPQKVAYYELKVEFEISGNYSSYIKFRKGLADLKKIINISQEKITVVKSETKKGEVKVTTILAIYRLPATESEKYATQEEETL
jgi:Tfp pilus assembly protein PilO